MKRKDIGTHYHGVITTPLEWPLFAASNHHLYRQNLYRYNRDRGLWEFYDGVGPWTPREQQPGEEPGFAVMRQMGYVLLENN